MKIFCCPSFENINAPTEASSDVLMGMKHLSERNLGKNYVFHTVLLQRKHFKNITI